MFRWIMTLAMILAAMTAAAIPTHGAHARTDSLMAVLDDVIARRPEYLQEKPSA